MPGIVLGDACGGDRKKNTQSKMIIIFGFGGMDTSTV